MMPGADLNFTPEIVRELLTGMGMAFFSQQRAFGPWTPFCTKVQAEHCASYSHQSWQLTQVSMSRLL
jgi:hypothetical protein